MGVDVNFTANNERFNMRVAAYITCKNKVLLQKDDRQTFWNMVGGRAQINESTDEAIAREIKEELGLDISNGKLMVVAENFFNWQGNNVTELLFVYHVELNEVFVEMLEGNRVVDKPEEVLKWFDVKELKNIECKPQLIYDLPNLPKTEITHIINK